MSYLKELVENAKQTEGYTGRERRRYAQLDHQNKREDTDMEEESGGPSKWILYGAGGLLVVAGGVIAYKKFKNRGESSNPSRQVSNQSQPRDEETRAEIEKLRQIRQQRKEQKVSRDKSELEEFVNQVPDRYLKDKDRILRR